MVKKARKRPRPERGASVGRAAPPHVAYSLYGHAVHMAMQPIWPRSQRPVLPESHCSQLTACGQPVGQEGRGGGGAGGARGGGAASLSRV
jgi:hypothetical protein